MVGKHPMGSSGGSDGGSGDATMLLKPATGGISLPSKERLVFGRVQIDLIKGNPCIVGGAELLILAAELRSNPNIFLSLQDVQDLARSMLRTYADKLATSGLESGQADQAHMIMCVLIDDIALSGPWGGKSAWRQNSLNTEFHAGRQKPDFVFELARDLAERPEQSRHLAELVYVALAIGFEGSFRTDPRGPILLTQHRERLLRTLRARKGGAGALQSVSWGGGKKTRGPSFVNPVTLTGAVIVVAVGVVSAVIWSRGGTNDQVSRLTSSNVTPTAPIVAPDKSDGRLADRVRLVLRAEIEAEGSTIEETDDAVIVRIPISALRKGGSAGNTVLPEGMGRHLSAAVAPSNGPTYVVGFVSRSSSPSAEERKKIQSTRRLVAGVGQELRDLLGKEADVIGLTLTAGGNSDDGSGPELDPDYLHIVVPKNVPPPSSFTRQDYQPAWY